MHNTHYIIVKAKNKEQASNLAEDIYFNNCSDNISICIEEILKVGDTKDNAKINTILKYLNKTLNSLQEVKAQIKELFNKEEDIGFNYYSLSQLCMDMYQLLQYGQEPLSLENIENCNDFYGYEFDKYGITNITNDTSVEGKDTFVVVLDVHI